MKKAIIFDLDGTLANTLDSMAAVMNGLLSELGFSKLPVDNYRYYCGEGASVLVKKCLQDAGDLNLQYYVETERAYRERFNKDPLFRVSHYPGMPEVLEKLKAEGVLLAVCSNKPDPAAKLVIESMFGTKLFEEILGQREGIQRKPAPDGPLLIAKHLGVRPEDCIYVGDTWTDMQTGKAAGMYTVGVLWGFREREELLENGADAFAEKPEDLLSLIKG